MTEKRFTAIPETVSYKDNLTGERLCPKHEKDYYAVLNKMNKLSEENKQLKQQNKELKLDNDIKFWKHQFMMKYNTTQLIMHELAKAIDNGYEVSSEFQKYLNELKARDSENREKMERLGI